MLSICLTFDYELFLGKNNASYDEILFSPTKKLCNMLQSYDVSGTFFVDVCSLFAHKKANNATFVEGFENQIRYLVEHNQDIQLHIHTNWIKSDLTKNTISTEGYRIHEFGFDKNDPNSGYYIIKNGVDYLNQLCRQVKKDYCCCAYRAGGFCAQPESQLIECLFENGIKLDSSVAPGMVADTGTHRFDYSMAPLEFGWWVNNNLCKKVKKNDSRLFEVPVLTTKPNVCVILKTGLKNIKLPPQKIKGEYINSSHSNKNNSFIQKIKKVFNRFFSFRTINFDSQSYIYVFNTICKIEKKLSRRKKDGVVSIICHPKLLDDSRIENIENFISLVKKYNDNIMFTNFNELNNSLKIQKGDLYD